MPEEDKNSEALPEKAADPPVKSPFSAAEALLASIAVILLLVIILYSFFHSDRQADPVVVYLAESVSTSSAQSDSASTHTDQTVIPGLNLAAESEESSSSSSESADGSVPSAVAEESGEAAIPVININTATASELTQLPGIGEVKAAAIIAYREEFGAFLSVSQLLNVSGIGEKTLDKIRDYIVLS